MIVTFMGVGKDERAVLDEAADRDVGVAFDRVHRSTRELDRLLTSKGISVSQANGLACGACKIKGRNNKEK